MVKTGALNVLLRSLTLAAKFVLLLFLARYLGTEQLGVYGLMVTTLAISILLLGADFYIYNTREILAGNLQRSGPLIKNQMIFHGIAYAVVLPLLLVVFAGGVLSWRLFGWFFGLVILEHLSQESFRLLITFSRSTLAHVVLLLRSGAWVYAVVSLAYWWPELRSLTVIWAGWVVGLVVSLGVAAWGLRWLSWSSVLRSPVDKGWIRRGYRTCLPLFAATVALTGTQYADRYFIHHHLGDEMVGVYTFFGSIANVVPVFVFSAVTMVLQPRVIAAYQQARFQEYRRHMHRLGLGTAGVMVLLTAGAAFAITPLLSLVGKEVFSFHINTFWLLLAAMGMMTISLVPHQALYARKQDGAIIVSTLLAFAVAIAANALLVPRMGLAGGATATLGAMSTLALSKTVFLVLPASKDISGEAGTGTHDFIADKSRGSGSMGGEHAEPTGVGKGNEVTRCG